MPDTSQTTGTQQQASGLQVPYHTHNGLDSPYIATQPSSIFLATGTYDPAGIKQQVVGLTATQTLTNKTLTQPIITASIPTTVVSTAASGAVTLDLSTGNVQNFTFSGSSASDAITFFLSNATVGQIFMVTVTQNSGGSGTVTWWTTIRWAGGTTPTLTTTGGQRDTFVFVTTSSVTWDGYIAGQNL